MYQTQNADFVNVAVGNVNETLGDGIWGSIPPKSGRVEDELDGWVAKCAQDCAVFGADDSIGECCFRKGHS
jgi:hypothetical protein